MKSFYHFAYGLNFKSVLHCPELLPGNPPPDVTIRYGDVPTALENPEGTGVLYQTKPGAFLLQLERIARYLALDGKEILIDRAPDSRDDEVRLFLYGSVLGALLHQRGLLVLHGSAIETKNGAVVFLGRSGVGKSTLAGALQDRGYRVLADDIAAITFGNNGTPKVLPAYPQVNIWADVVEALGKDTHTLQSVRPELEKYALPLRERFADEPLPLCAVYVLATTNTRTFEIEPVESMNKFKVFADNTYRFHFLEGLGLRKRHFQSVLALSKSVKVNRVTRPSAPLLLDELVALLEKDFG